MHLVVLFGYQGAAGDAEQLALTEQLFDAALGELGAVARGQPCMPVGDFNVEPTKIPCLAKGFPLDSGLTLRLLGLWLLVFSLLLLASVLGVLLVVIVGTSWSVALLLLLFFPVGFSRVAPHLAVRIEFDCVRWTCRVTKPVERTPLWPAAWLPAVDKG